MTGFRSLVATAAAAVSILGSCITYLPAALCESDNDCLTTEVCLPAGVCATRDPGSPVDDSPDAESTDAELTGTQSDTPVCELTEVRVLSPTTLQVTVSLPQWPDSRAVRVGGCARRTDDQRQSSVCASLQPSEASTLIELTGLSAGLPVEVFAFVLSDTTNYASEGQTLVMPPAAINDLIASDGLSPDFVDLRWTGVPGAESYIVWRDGLLLGTTTATFFLDRDAEAGGVPPSPVDFSASEGTDDDVIMLQWQPPEPAPGAVHEYQVIAAGAGGISPRSEVEIGYRSGFPVSGYTIVISDERRVSVGGVTSYMDRLAPAGSLTLGNLTASDGELLGQIEATFASVVRVNGAPLSYTLRALNAAGIGEQSTATGWRAAPTPEFTWAREPDPFRSGTWTELAETSETLVLDSTPRELVRVRAEWMVNGQLQSDTARGWAAECMADAACEEEARCVAGGCAPAGTVIIPPHSRRLGRISDNEPNQTFEDLRFDARFVYRRMFMQSEVTQAEWMELMGTVPFQFPACGDDCPAENISWGASLAYANARSRRDGLPPCYDLSGCTGDPTDGTLSCAANPPLNDGHTSVYACEGWRLPTEFEWEWAAHAVPDSDRWVPFSRSGSCTDSASELDESARVCTSAIVDWPGCAADVPGQACAGPGPVASLNANPWGLYDVLGNVAEFTWSRRVPVPWRYEEIVEPEMATSAGDLTIRGGSWRSRPVDARIPGRDAYPWTYRGGDVGFRLVRTLLNED